MCVVCGMHLVTSPIRITYGSKEAKVPSGSIPLEEPAKATGEYVAILSHELFEGYRIQKLKKIPNFRVEFVDD